MKAERKNMPQGLPSRGTSPLDHDALAHSVTSKATLPQVSSATKAKTSANDHLQGLQKRLIIDDRDPYFVTSVEGNILFCNDKYRVLANDCSGSLARPSDDPKCTTAGRINLSVMTVVEEVEALEKPMVYKVRILVNGQEKHF